MVMMLIACLISLCYVAVNQWTFQLMEMQCVQFMFISLSVGAQSDSHDLELLSVLFNATWEFSVFARWFQGHLFSEIPVNGGYSVYTV